MEGWDNAIDVSYERDGASKLNGAVGETKTDKAVEQGAERTTGRSTTVEPPSPYPLSLGEIKGKWGRWPRAKWFSTFDDRRLHIPNKVLVRIYGCFVSVV